jgi:glucose-1-phosphate thymidylyltransferase
MGVHVVIPVAGVGTRLRPHTHTRPKVLVHVAGKPMLGHILDELRQYDVTDVTLVIGHLGEDVIEYVKGAFDYKFNFVWQEEMKGLGHAIWLTAEHLRKSKDPIFIVLGDTLFDANFDTILHSKDNWIGVKEVEDPRRFGVIVLENGLIKSMVEKPKDPPTNLAIVGIYLLQDAGLLYSCLDRVVEDNVRSAGEIQLTDGLQRMIDAGAKMKPFEINEWFDCGKPETLLDTNRRMLARLAGKNGAKTPQFPGSVVRPPVAIEAGAQIFGSIIGPNVTVAEGAIIKDSIITDSIISANAEVSQSILDQSIIADHSKVVGHTYQLNVGDSSEVRIG